LRIGAIGETQMPPADLAAHPQIGGESHEHERRGGSTTDRSAARTRRIRVIRPMVRT
jgi:hypothetical protein